MTLGNERHCSLRGPPRLDGAIKHGVDSSSFQVLKLQPSYAHGSLRFVASMLNEPESEYDFSFSHFRGPMIAAPDGGWLTRV